jgi:hypothetical protein
MVMESWPVELHGGDGGDQWLERHPWLEWWRRWLGFGDVEMDWMSVREGVKGAV